MKAIDDNKDCTIIVGSFDYIFFKVGGGLLWLVVAWTTLASKLENMGCGDK